MRHSIGISSTTRGRSPGARGVAQLATERKQVIDRVSEVLGGLSQGDLSSRVQGEFGAEFTSRVQGEFGAEFNVLRDNLNENEAQ